MKLSQKSMLRDALILMFFLGFSINSFASSYPQWVDCDGKSFCIAFGLDEDFFGGNDDYGNIADISFSTSYKIHSTLFEQPDSISLFGNGEPYTDSLPLDFIKAAKLNNYKLSIINVDGHTTNGSCSFTFPTLNESFHYINIKHVTNSEGDDIYSCEQVW